ncbi:MAG: transporter substrate-binding domain-containing protein [Pseudomonadaceae bacterium]|nr:transporter substrate-binding domain-containing protein [Pseudomonadaceae bacterium]
MNKAQWWKVALLAAVVGGLAGWLVAPEGNGGGAVAQETALERVLRTGVLRCAYTTAPSFIEKDPNTGEMSGLGYAITEELGKVLGVKVQWGPEVGPHEVFEGFNNNAFDANCTGYWRTPERAHGGDFSDPIFYTTAHLFVRKGETRFKTLADFDSKDVTFIGMDGEGTNVIVKRLLPQANLKLLPGMVAVAERFMSVADGKGDVTAADLSMGASFMQNNPGKIEVFPSPPLETTASVILIAHHQEGLKSFLNAGIAALREKGILNDIIAKHDVYPGSFLPPASQVGRLDR